RTLLADDPDEVVQRTWMLAVRRGGAGVEAPRAWLGRVVRSVASNLRRDRDRRRRREADAALQAAAIVPSSAELMQQEEQRRVLVHAVDRLPAPLRAVVLLRWFDGLPPREIARRLDLPVTTVWNQLRTALQLLRERLDQDHGGRRAWLLPLVPFAAGGPPLPPTTLLAATLGGLLMNAKAKLTVAAVAAFALVGAAVLWSDPATPPAPRSRDDRVATATAPDASTDPGGDAASHDERRTATDATPGVAPPNVGSTGALVVHTRWSDGSPAAGLTILASGEWLSVRTDGRRAHTDADGDARFDDLRPGVYRICANRCDPGTNVTVPAGVVTELDHRLRSGITFTGIVVDRDGAAVADALVEVASLSGPDDEIAVQTTTDRAGRFELRDTGTAVFLGARAQGHGASRIRLWMGEPGDRIELRLVLGPPSGSVRGVVVDADGRPVAGAAVRVGDGRVASFVERDSGDGLAPAGALTHTDAAGTFDAVGVLPGRHPIQVRAAGAAPWSGACDVVAHVSTALRIELAPGAVVRGRVLDAAGEGVADATVRFGSSGAEFTFRSAEARADGTYELTGLPPGEVSLVAEHRDRGRRQATLSTIAGAVTPWDPVLDAGVALAGRTVDTAGAPLAGVTIEAYCTGAVTWHGLARSDDEGAFELHGAPADSTLSLRAWGEGLRPMHRTVTTPIAEPVVLRFERPAPPSATVRGVVLGPDGRPAANAQVDAHRLDVEEVTHVRVTDAAGAFALTPLPAGRWRVAVRVDGCAPWISAPVTLAANTEVDLGDVPVTPGGRLRVRPTGPLGDARVVLIDRDDALAAGLTRDGDSLQSGPLAPGSYRVLVSGRDVAAQRVEVEVVDGETAVVELAPHGGTQVQFELESMQEQLPESAVLQARRDDQLELFCPVPLYPGRATRRTFALVPGTYRVAVVVGDRELAEATLRVGEADGTPLRLVLR
ncbi:MAG: sigma-70 family RNA polymerase sigma factor, partial [Planctomycetota bacterium]